MRIIITVILIMLLPISIIVTHNHYRHNNINLSVVGSPIPKIQFWKTKNGVETYFVSKPNSNIIDIQITFDAGSARDNGKLGLAYLVSKTIKDLVNKKDFDLEVVIDKDRTIFSFKLINNAKKLDKKIKQQVDVLSGYISRLFLWQADLHTIVDHLKNNILSDLKLKSQDPLHVLNTEIYKLLYNKHPYANYELGNGELDNITVEDLINFHKSYYVTDNAIITIVGNANRDQAINLSNLITANFVNGSKAVPLPDLQLPDNNIFQIGSFRRIGEDNQQKNVIMGQIVANAYDNEYFNLILGNMVLSNNIYSRLSKLTQQLGGGQEDAIYDVSSKFVMLGKTGPFLVNFYTTKQFTEKAIETINIILSNFINYGPTKEELELCKQHLINSFPGEFITNQQVLDWISYLSFYKLPMDFFDHYIDNVYSVTHGSVLNAWKSRVNVQHMQTVIIG